MDYHPDNRPIEDIYAERKETNYIAPPAHYLLTSVIDFHPNNLLIEDTFIEEGEDILFKANKTAIIRALNMNCGQMTYNFYDGGGTESNYADTGLDQEFTVCPENPMNQRIVSLQFKEFNLEWQVSEFFDEVVDNNEDTDGFDNTNSNNNPQPNGATGTVERNITIKRDALCIHDGQSSAALSMTDNHNEHYLSGYREDVVLSGDQDLNGDQDPMNPSTPVSPTAGDPNNNVLENTNFDANDRKTAHEIADMINGISAVYSYDFLDDDIRGGAANNFDANTPDELTTNTRSSGAALDYTYTLMAEGFDSGDENGYERQAGNIPNNGRPIYIGKGDPTAINFTTQNLNDGSGCLTFVLKTDGNGVASGWEAEITTEEFHPYINILPLVTDLNGDGDTDDELEVENDGEGIPASSMGNGIVEIMDCSLNIPDQHLKLDVGCGLYTEGQGANPNYEYDLIVNNQLVSTGERINEIPRIAPIAGSALIVGQNEVVLELYYNDGNSRTLKVTTTTTIIVNTLGALACNDEINLGMSNDCETTIGADDLIENPCRNGENGEFVNNYVLKLTLVTADEDFMNLESLDLPAIINNNSPEVTLQVPGRYRYTVTLGDNTCWGFINLEDKRGPSCNPAKDREMPITWDHDCDPETEPELRPDPSGEDDLAAEYILCEVIEREGLDIFFDELELMDGFIDANDDGEQGEDEFAFEGDFDDCTGLREIYYEEETVEICNLNDLSGYPIDETKVNLNRYEICTIYSRTWYAVDTKGMRSSSGCTQYVYSVRPKASTIEIDQLAAIECGEDLDETKTYPYYIVRPGDIANNGAGSVNSYPINKRYELEPAENTCKYGVSFTEDPRISTCGAGSPTYKQNRHWTVTDWCDGDRVFDQFTQLIKIEDTKAPIAVLAGTENYLPTDTILRTQLFDCVAYGNIPLLELKDTCSTADFYNVSIQRIDGLEELYIRDLSNGMDITDFNISNGKYRITYRYEDLCGNRDEVSIEFTFIDTRLPQAICNDELNITLIPTGTPGSQLARIYGEDLDDSSYDNCHELIYQIRRGDAMSLPWADYVEFNCSDVGNENLKVELRVIGDANDNGRYDEGELSNICWTTINVEDKTPPVLSIENGEYLCNDPEFNHIILNKGLYNVDQGDDLFPTVVGGCTEEGVIIELLEVDDSAYDPICKVGTFERKFVAFRSIHDNQAFSDEVTQRIAVRFHSDWSMNFPADMVIQCDANTASSLEQIPAPLRIEQILTNEGCDQWGLETKDEIFDIVGQDGDGACYKVIRTYKLINWCTWDPNHSETGVVPRPIDFFTDTDLTVNLAYQSQAVTNICELRNDLDDRNDGDIYDLFLENFDNDPRTTNFPDERDADFIYVDEDTGFGSGDCIENNFNALFGESLDFSPSFDNEFIYDDQHHNFVSGEAYGYFIYRQIIKVADSVAPVIDVIPDMAVCNNSNDGCAVEITLPIPNVDDCKPSYSITYRVDLNGDGDTNDGNENGRFLGNPITGFTAPTLTNIGYGNYKITYRVDDSCGNASQMEFNLTARDCKPPVAYCRGISLDLNPDGTVEMWASDMDAGSYDNCSEEVTLSFSPTTIQKNKVFTCDNLGAQLVALYVNDANGNQSFCEAQVYIQSDDLDSECSSGALISGQITTESGNELEGAMVNVNGDMNMEMATSVNGNFSLEVGEGGDYTITSQKDTDVLNGVSTFDMILIRKHILGLQKFDSPYKMIAADINQSQTITTLDMVVLRKLILGVITEFENNTSWRFVDAAYQFANPSNPWATVFPEYININNIDLGTTTSNFIAIKIGDVNDSAIPNGLMSIEERSGNTDWTLNVKEQQLMINEVYEIPFFASTKGIEGYQFTLNTNADVDLLEVKSGQAKVDHFGIQKLTEGQLTVSWNGAAIQNIERPLFTLVLSAKKAVKLSETVIISSEVTTAEAYTENGSTHGIALVFNNKTADNQGYSLAQNRPNPFQGNTTISFTLPHNTTATIMVTDLTGRMIWKHTETYTAGLQNVVLKSSDLPSNGVLYYHLETSDFKATRRMIIVK